MGWVQRRARRRRHECIECGTPLVACSWPEARGQSGAFEMRLRQVPLLRCAADADHPMVVDGPEFSVALADAVQCSDLAVARLGSFNSVNCCSCALALDGADSGILTTRANVDVEALGAIDVELTGPAATCEACGTKQVYATYGEDDDYNVSLCACCEALPVELP